MAKRGRPKLYQTELRIPVTQRQHDALAAASTLAGVPLAQIVRDAVDSYLSALESEAA